TAQEMRRKGSWAVRFYGRAGRLPALKDEAGRAPRLAPPAAARGGPGPKTPPAAKRIAAKGPRLLRLYRRIANAQRPFGLRSSIVVSGQQVSDPRVASDLVWRLPGIVGDLRVCGRDRAGTRPNRGGRPWQHSRAPSLHCGRSAR